MSNRPINNLGEKYINGLNLSRTSNTAISIATGQTRDSQNINDILVSEAISINTSVSGVNGLDTGTIAPNNIYAVYVVADSLGNNEVGGVLSLNVITPLLPAGYDVYRRVGAVLTNGSSQIVNFQQYGSSSDRKMFYIEPVNVLLNGNATVLTDVDLSSAVPNLKLEVIATIGFIPDSATNTAHIVPPGVASAGGYFNFGCGVAEYQVGTAILQADIAHLGSEYVVGISYQVTNAADNLNIAVVGYIDQL